MMGLLRVRTKGITKKERGSRGKKFRERAGVDRRALNGTIGL